MVFLKSLLFIVWNIAIPFLMVFSVKAILFIPKTEKRMFGKKIPFTPGLLYRKKKWLIDKIRKESDDYLLAADSDDENTKIARWEKKAYKKAWDKLHKVENIIWLPAKVKQNLRAFFASFIYYFVRQFLRSFVPFLMRKYNTDKYIDLLDKKLDMGVVTEYFNKYVYKYLLLFFCGIAFLISIWNMILFWIIG